MTRDDCQALDAQDPLAALRDQFLLPEGKLYLDGNSLGVLPRATPRRVAEVIEREWGQHLIESWNTAHWMELPRRVGNKIARLVGAGPDELLAADSTSVNLFKVLSAALSIARCDARDASKNQRVILSERDNFPTDLYIAESLARERGFELVLADSPQAIEPRLAQGDVAVLMLTQVNYRTGYLHDMAALTAAAHGSGALAVWDLAHSAGALPVHLKRDDADFAVGCGYKYLNGGPGAPAFVWAHPRHADRFLQPLSGWMGHAAPFAFEPGYAPAPGIARYLCGTPPVIQMAALECGVDSVLAAEPLGGIDALRSKSLALTECFMRLVAERCAGHGLALVTPQEAPRRGSQVSYAREERDGGGGYAIVQALIARGVVGDFREGNQAHPAAARDVLRFGFTPLYLRFVDVWDAVEHLRQVLASGEWKQERCNKKAAVT
jgi:kynureninase